MKKSGKTIFLYIGGLSLLPENWTKNIAYSPAGQMFQLNMVKSAIRVGIPIDRVLSYYTIPDVRKGGPLLVPGRVDLKALPIHIRFLPFINVILLKQLTITLGVLIYITFWSIIVRSRRRAPHIWIYNFTVPPILPLYFLCQLLRIPIVANINDVNIPGETSPNGALFRLDFWQNRKFIPRIFRLICSSDAIADDLAPGKKYLRIEGGVNEIVFQKTIPLANRVQTESEVFSFAGSLDEPNGIEVILKAAESVPPNVKFIIAGAGPLTQKVLSASSRFKNIEFLGSLTFEEVLALYNRSDFLLNIRLTKQINTKYFFPSKMMEYLASGVPVLTTSTGHTGRELSSFVYTLSDESPEGLVKSIGELLHIPKPKRAARALSGRKYARERLMWDVRSREIADFITH